MNQYIVKTGENIFDIALTLSGTIEGIWDLLVSNDWLSMDTELTKGMVLNYHPEFVVNKNIVSWLKSNGVVVKNGHHYERDNELEDVVYNKMLKMTSSQNGTDKNAVIEKYFRKTGIFSNFDSESCDLYWDSICRSKIIVDHYGNYSCIVADIGNNGFIGVDWGDDTEMQIFSENEKSYWKEKIYIEHEYKDIGRHTIRLYGIININKLDFSELNGVYYVIYPVHLNEFIGNSASSYQLNKLLITN